MQAQVDRPTRKIVAVGTFPAGSPDPAIDIVELRDDQIERLAQPGEKILEADGTITVTPPPPPPLVYGGHGQIGQRIRTPDATPAELARWTLSPLTGYAADLHLLAVDAGNGALRMIHASIVAKRLNGGAVLVGAPVVIANHADAAAATWTIVPSVNGNDVVVTVTGAAGRTVDWLLDGSVRSFTPAGRT